MSESESLSDQYGAFEQEADELLGEVGDGDGDRSVALVKRFRRLAKQHRAALEQVASETRAQVLAEQTQARQSEAAFRRLAVPQTARALFEGVDVADDQAMQARAVELREAGVPWGGQPTRPPPPPPDPNLAAMRQMQQAEMGAFNGAGEELEARLERMAKDPGSYTEAQRDAVVKEVNARVRAAQTPSSGALG